MKEFNLKVLFSELIKNKGLLKISIWILVVSSLIIYIFYYIWSDVLIFLSIIGFAATLYSIILTMILYNFLHIADAEFLINTQRYIETNSKKLTKHVAELSEYMKMNLRTLQTSSSQIPTIEIPDDIHDMFRYLLIINRKYINERTSLYQCRDSFKLLEQLIEETQILKLSSFNEIEIEKADELTQQLVELLVELDTIFYDK